MKATLSTLSSYQIQMLKSVCPRRRSGWHIDKVDAPFDYLHIHTPESESVDNVSSVDDVAERFIAGGGDVIRPKLTIPGVGSLISCEDAAGQVFSFFEEEYGA
ncbi:hypothetical protein Ga0123462_0919 [Mariprofundus ferrinatatus]|uniref:Uncharacterized protein n=2 Tax=Mariprofundus ferrinatatus TaxID=1921087 RepID=A0A2K8L382_9PROT|nr:hypothetical protein Ga0123462_0919 [Mariprofundus ferrinatatus]